MNENPEEPSSRGLLFHPFCFCSCPSFSNHHQWLMPFQSGGCTAATGQPVTTVGNLCSMWVTFQQLQTAASRGLLRRWRSNVGLKLNCVLISPDTEGFVGIVISEMGTKETVWCMMFFRWHCNRLIGGIPTWNVSSQSLTSLANWFNNAFSAFKLMGHLRAFKHMHVFFSYALSNESFVAPVNMQFSWTHVTFVFRLSWNLFQPSWWTQFFFACCMIGWHCEHPTQC